MRTSPFLKPDLPPQTKKGYRNGRPRTSSHLETIMDGAIISAGNLEKRVPRERDIVIKEERSGEKERCTSSYGRVTDGRMDEGIKVAAIASRHPG